MIGSVSNGVVLAGVATDVVAIETVQLAKPTPVYPVKLEPTPVQPAFRVEMYLLLASVLRIDVEVDVKGLNVIPANLALINVEPGVLAPPRETLSDLNRATPPKARATTTPTINPACILLFILDNYIANW